MQRQLTLRKSSGEGVHGLAELLKNFQPDAWVYPANNRDVPVAEQRVSPSRKWIHFPPSLMTGTQPLAQLPSLCSVCNGPV